MSIDGENWKIWRDAPELSQRFDAVISPDSNTIDGTWQKRHDGGAWDHDFDVAYRRVDGR
jgi:hypothetical protein